MVNKILEQECIDMFNEGLRPIDIAIQNNQCIRKVHKVLKQACEAELIDINNPPRTLMEPYFGKRDTNILNLWNEKNQTYQSIAETVGLTRERVRQILAKAKRKGFFVENVSTVSKKRSKQSNLSKLNNIKQDAKEEILEQYHGGIPLDKIFKSLNSNISQNSFRLFCAFAKKENLFSYKKHILSQIKNHRLKPDALTLFRESTIIKMRTENKTLDEIALNLDLGKIRVTQIIRRMKNKGINIPNSRISGGALSQEEILKRVSLIDSYLDDQITVRQIAELLSMSPQHVSMLIFTHLVEK